MSYIEDKSPSYFDYVTEFTNTMAGFLAPSLIAAACTGSRPFAGKTIWASIGLSLATVGFSGIFGYGMYNSLYTKHDNIVDTKHSTLIPYTNVTIAEVQNMATIDSFLTAFGASASIITLMKIITPDNKLLFATAMGSLISSVKTIVFALEPNKYHHDIEMIISDNFFSKRLPSIALEIAPYSIKAFAVDAVGIFIDNKVHPYIFTLTTVGSIAATKFITLSIDGIYKTLINEEHAILNIAYNSTLTNVAKALNFASNHYWYTNPYIFINPKFVLPSNPDSSLRSDHPEENLKGYPFTPYLVQIISGTLIETLQPYFDKLITPTAIDAVTYTGAYAIDAVTYTGAYAIDTVTYTGAYAIDTVTYNIKALQIGRNVLSSSDTRTNETYIIKHHNQTIKISYDFKNNIIDSKLIDSSSINSIDITPTNITSDLYIETNNTESQMLSELEVKEVIQEDL